jgi:predicted HD phosphohydrolase
MEKILIDWLIQYTEVSAIDPDTKFSDLNFDIFDEAMTADFIQKTFDIDVLKKIGWFETIKDLIIMLKQTQD